MGLEIAVKNSQPLVATAFTLWLALGCRPVAPPAAIPSRHAEIVFAITATERIAVRTTALTRSDSNMVVVGGDFKGTLALGDFRLKSRGGNDGFVAAFALPTGTVEWVTHLGGPLDDYVRSISVTPGEMLLVGGEFSTDSPALPSPAIPPISGTGPRTQSATIAFFDLHGNSQWSRTLKGSRYASVTAVAALAVNDVIIAGYFAGTLATDQRSHLEMTSAGGQDLFVARYSNNGQLLWLKRGGGPNSEIARALVVSDSEIAISGSTGNSASFGPHVVKTSSQGTNALIARVLPNGDFAGAATTTQQEPISAHSIVLARNGNYIAATSTIPALVQTVKNQLVPIGKILNLAKVTALATTPDNKTLIAARIWPTDSGQGVATAITVGDLQEQTKTITLTSSQFLQVSAMAANTRVIVCVGQHIGMLRVGSTSVPSDPEGSSFLAILPAPHG